MLALTAKNLMLADDYVFLRYLLTLRQIMYPHPWRTTSVAFRIAYTSQARNQEPDVPLCALSLTRLAAGEISRDWSEVWRCSSVLGLLSVGQLFSPLKH